MQSLSVQMLDPALLTPNPWNTNVVAPDDEVKIENSIKRFGMFKPVIVRELPNGQLQIVGGEHRATCAKRLKIKEIPVVNLGRIDEKRAKEIGIADNSRYGNDDTLRLAELLDGLGNPEELSTFLPYSDADLASIFSSVNIALDDLDLDGGLDDAPSKPTEKPMQTHAVMRFKVPVGDVAAVTELFERVMKTQRFTEEDSLTNAGNALVHVCMLARDLG